MKGEPTQWEKIFARYSFNGRINIQNKELKKLNIKRKNNPTNKWANEMHRHFSNEEVQITNKCMKKIFIIFSHQGNTNQNHTEVPLTPVS
jgi:hypothetical protein